MPGVLVLLAFLALIAAIMSATSPPRCPLWVAVVLLCIIALLQVWRL